MSGQVSLRPAHEMAGLASLALMCGLSPSTVRVCLSTEYEDKHESTDMWLVHGRSRLRIDLTKGRPYWKIVKNKDHRNRDPRSIWVWGLQVPPSLGCGFGIAVHPCFQQLWERVGGGDSVSVTRVEICPQHGARCKLIGLLESLGRELVSHLPEGNERNPKNWKALFEQG